MVSEYVGHTEEYLLGVLEGGFDFGQSYLDWRDSIPRCIHERWGELSAEAKLTAICVAGSKT